MKIARTFDEQLVWDCIVPVYDYVSDDNSPSADLYFPDMRDEIYWLAAYDETGLLGVFMAHPHNSVCYESHTLLLPSARGKAMRAGRLAIDWLFQNSRCEKIITNVPAYNILALALAHRVGFKDIGINTKSFLKNGVLYDQHILGFSKGE